MWTPVCVLLTALLLCNVFCEASPDVEKAAAKSDIRSKRTATKVAELREKLSNLEKLLNDYEKSGQEKETAPTTPAPVAKPEQKNISGEETLSKQDIILLKSLKAALHNLREEKQKQTSDGETDGHVDKSKNMGQFLEAPIDETGSHQENDKRTAHDRFYLQDPGNSHQAQDGIPAKRTSGVAIADTKHGNFGKFSENVKAKVVYRLLADLDLALKNGISVEEIIEYLYHMEAAARDRHQRNRIEDEENQLKALLNQEPVPRD